MPRKNPHMETLAVIGNHIHKQAEFLGTQAGHQTNSIPAITALTVRKGNRHYTSDQRQNHMIISHMGPSLTLSA